MVGKGPKLKWNQYPIEDDIKFRGPLNYRHFKIIGWLLFVLKMLIPPLKLATRVNPTAENMLALPIGIMELFAPLSVFFLLIASMSQLLAKRDYKRQLIVNGAAALGIIVFFELFYHHYIVGYVDAFVENRPATLMICNEVFSELNPMGFVTFNVFIDLFLCTCVIFFLNYEPTKFFVGNRLKWFRCLTILPVIYELVCLGLKLRANAGDFHAPISFFPFLPTKPPMMFFVFCAMVVFQVLRERRFCEDGRTREEYEQYLDTNRNRWGFAKFAAIACVVAGLLDLAIVVFALVSETGSNMSYVMTLSDESFNVWFYGLVDKYLNAGFGGSVDLILVAPVMLLFDYTKTYKNTIVEIAIPVVAVVLLVFIYLEGSLFAVRAIAKVTKEQVLPQIGAMLTQMDEEAGGAGDELDALLMTLAAEEAAAAATNEAPKPANGSAQQQAPAQAPEQAPAYEEYVPEGAPA